MEPDDFELMVDIETFGRDNRATILSVGVTVFSEYRSDPKCDTIYFKIPLQPQLEKGRTVDAETIAWWLQQKEEIPLCDKGSRVDLIKCLIGLGNFFNKYKGRKVWAHGTTFDIIKLESLFEDFGMEVPWKYWDIMDCRTVTNLINCRSKSNNHNALDDAINQAQWILDAKAVLKDRGVS